MRGTVFWALALLVLAAPLRAHGAPGDGSELAPTPARQYQELVRAYEAARKDAEEAARLARSPLERKKAAEKYPQSGEYAPRFLKLAEAYPQDAAALNALLWVVVSAPHAPEADRAVEWLLRDHLSSPKLVPVCRWLLFAESPTAEQRLRDLLAKNPSREVQAWACYALASRLKERGDRAARGGQPDAAPWTREAQELYERLVGRYADVRSSGISPAEAARPDLFELRDLAVGKKAPEIEGRDLDGRKLRLSDFRGQVVVLDFWVSWCGPCQALFPQERALVKRLAGRPFALLGVNGDGDRDAVRELARKEGLTWRSWWDGGGAPTAARWNVRTWPTVYVLDHQGVIRARDVRGTALDELVDRLLREAEQAADKDRPPAK